MEKDLEELPAGIRFRASGGKDKERLSGMRFPKKEGGGKADELSTSLTSYLIR